jgi:hypothetical protein
MKKSKGKYFRLWISNEMYKKLSKKKKGSKRFNVNTTELIGYLLGESLK